MKKPVQPPPDVKCSRVKCRGANHDPSCPVYIWAVENWDVKLPEKAPPKVREKRGRHPAETGARRLTPEERAEISRTNGMKGGAPRSELPVDLLKVLRKGQFRVKEEFKKGDEIGEAAVGVAGYALERLAYVAAGRVSHRKAPSVVKACQSIREEICEPIEKAMIHKGGIDLGAAVDKALAATTVAPSPQPNPRPSDEEPSKDSIQ